jgi:DNA-binding MarR family transcriptional regulator
MKYRAPIQAPYFLLRSKVLGLSGPLDRLEERDLVTRSRDRADRRVITIRITEWGLRVLGELDEPIQKLHVGQLGHLGPERLRSLIDLLDSARRAHA